MGVNREDSVIEFNENDLTDEQLLELFDSYSIVSFKIESIGNEWLKVYGECAKIRLNGISKHYVENETYSFLAFNDVKGFKGSWSVDITPISNNTDERIRKVLMGAEMSEVITKVGDCLNNDVFCNGDFDELEDYDMVNIVPYL